MPEELENQMKVRVKEGHKGFIYGSLRREGAEFTLKSFEHPKKTDENDEPLVISIEQQFSKVWMEEVNPKKEEPKAQPEMTVAELKDALTAAGVEIPEKALKADLIALFAEQ